MKVSSNSSPSGRTDRFLAAVLATVLGLSLCGCAGSRRDPTISELQALVQPANRKPTKFDLPQHTFIYRGMSESELLMLLGKPMKVRKVKDGPPRKVWHYDFGLVILQDGKVILHQAKRDPKAVTLPSVSTP